MPIILACSHFDFRPRVGGGCVNHVTWAKSTCSFNVWMKEVVPRNSSRRPTGQISMRHCHDGPFPSSTRTLLLVNLFSVSRALSSLLWRPGIANSASFRAGLQDHLRPGTLSCRVRRSQIRVLWADGSSLGECGVGDQNQVACIVSAVSCLVLSSCPLCTNYGAKPLKKSMLSATCWMTLRTCLGPSMSATKFVWQMVHGGPGLKVSRWILNRIPWERRKGAFTWSEQMTPYLCQVVLSW